MAQSVMLDRASDCDPPKRPIFHTGLHSVPARRDLSQNTMIRPGKGPTGPDWIIDDFRELPSTALLSRVSRLPV